MKTLREAWERFRGFGDTPPRLEQFFSFWGDHILMPPGAFEELEAEPQKVEAWGELRAWSGSEEMAEVEVANIEAAWPEIERRVRSLILELTDTHVQTWEVERMIADAIKQERERLVRALGAALARAINCGEDVLSAIVAHIADKLEEAE